MLKTSAFQLVGKELGTTNFDVENKVFTFHRINYQNRFDNNIFIYHQGDAIIDSNLLLDFKQGWVTSDKTWRHNLNIAEDASLEQNYRISGVIVAGNLVVNGSIINSDGDTGAFLDVLGDIKAKNFIGGGSYVSIYGNANIEGVAYGHYNGGKIAISGDLTCPVFINEDHDFQYKKLIKNSIFLDSNTDHFMDREDDGNYVIPKKLRKDLIADVAKWDDILVLLGEGKNLLLSQGAKSSIKDFAYWLTRININGCNLEKVPKALITPELCEIAVEQREYAFRYVPEKMKTLALCELALVRSAGSSYYAGCNLEYIPTKMITKELCYKAARSKTQISYIPPDLLDYDLVYEVVSFNNDEFDSVPEEFKDKKMRKLLV
jgi:hypothetical protein